MKELNGPSHEATINATELLVETYRQSLDEDNAEALLKGGTGGNTCGHPQISGSFTGPLQLARRGR
jgi:Asp/Glu/hydantoin racemase